MRAKARIAIACLSAFPLAISAAPNLLGQNTAPAAGAPGAMHQDSANELSVAVGKSVLVDCARPVQRVAIGLGDVAEADAISPTEIMVNGKTAGETSLIIWDTSGGRQFFNVSVRASATAATESLESVRRELRAEFPSQQLKVSLEGTSVFLRGTVKDVASSDRAAKIAGMAGKVVNLLYVDTPAAPQQIMLKVKFASVDRSKEKQLGLNFFSTGIGNTLGGITTGEFNPPSVGTGSTAGTVTFSSQLNLMAFIPGLNAGATIQALISKGVAEILAEPNVIAQNGKEASFLAGGEYPYPVVQGGGAGSPATVTIEFKEYGVRLNFIPTITPRGTIRLQVAPEVSALDPSNAIELNGFSVPAITTRKVNTEVELGEGQTFVIGGLLDNRDQETLAKIPFIGDIPIIGKLFQSTQVTKTNTELIVLVTPEIVKPIDAAVPKPELKFPGSFLPPNTGGTMNNPETKAGSETPAEVPATMPVESAVDSLKPEKPLIIEGAQGGFGQSSAGAPATTSSGTSSAPQ